MDDNTLKVVERLVEAERRLADLRAKITELTVVIWDMEKKAAIYATDLERVNITTQDVRNVLGVLPNPEAIKILKGRGLLKNGEEEAKEEEEKED